MNGILLTETTETGVLDKIIDAIPKVVDLAMTTFDTMVDHPVLLFFVAVGFIGTGLGVFSMFKNASKN